VTPIGAAAGGGAVSVGGLSHRFPSGDARQGDLTALDSVDLEVEAGQFVALVGPSGCGKSTLLRVLAGLLVASAGTATVGGLDVVGRPGHAAYMPQKDLLLPWRRAIDNATLGAELDGRVDREARAEATALFERFGLAGFERAWPSQLSGGMRQRLALLRTFLYRRDVLLLDEPFGALDALTRRDMVSWLQGVWLDDRRSVVFVTHDVEEALVLADRVDVLTARPGRVVARVDVPFSRPRPASIVSDPAFVALRARIFDALVSGD
jgi:ABC-type nitrate/sulfonate/bicarbonate transport system ATPase subunit